MRGYNQILVAPEDVPKTAVITPFGLFEFLGYVDNQTIFCQPLEEETQVTSMLLGVGAGDEDIINVHEKEFLKAATDFVHESLKRLCGVFEPKGHAECVFGVDAIDFLGHRVTAQGIEPLPERVEAIHQFPRPQEAKSLGEFLGIVNFYHRFIPHAAALMGPLHSMSHVKGDKFQWSDQLQSAFDATKHALASATLLNHPSATATTCLTVDASDLGVLEQFLDGSWKPLAFFSRKLDKAQKSYSTFDRELLAIYSAIRHFAYFLEGRHFHIYTDHKPLTFALASGSEHWTPRQQRHLSLIAEYTTDIRHVHGRDNAVADALSRVDISINPVSRMAGPPSLDLLSRHKHKLQTQESRRILLPSLG